MVNTDNWLVLSRIFSHPIFGTIIPNEGLTLVESWDYHRNHQPRFFSLPFSVCNSTLAVTPPNPRNRSTLGINGLNGWIAAFFGLFAVFVAGQIIDTTGRRPVLIAFLSSNIVVKLLLFVSCFVPYKVFVVPWCPWVMAIFVGTWVLDDYGKIGI